MEFTKQELVEKAKEIVESESANKFKELLDLKKKWPKTYEEEESLYDKEMAEKFEAYLDQIAAIENANKGTAKENKENIISKAKELLNTKEFKAATTKMNELFEQFKNAGRCSKEDDDILWSQFKEIKDKFYALKKENYDNMLAKFEECKAAKQELINKAKAALELENINEANKQMTALMEEWKKTGSAGKEVNDTLWEEFSGIRKAFFVKKNEFYEHMKEEYVIRTEKKKDIITRARKCLACSTFEEEEVNEVKALRNEWKAVGFAGKENEDELWKEFSAIMNRYFDNMKYYG